MKLLAVVAIGVIALIESPAFSDELTFQPEQYFKLRAGRFTTSVNRKLIYLSGEKLVG